MRVAPVCRSSPRAKIVQNPYDKQYFVRTYHGTFTAVCTSCAYYTCWVFVLIDRRVAAAISSPGVAVESFDPIMVGVIILQSVWSGGRCLIARLPSSSPDNNNGREPCLLCPFARRPCSGLVLLVVFYYCVCEWPRWLMRIFLWQRI